MEGTQNVLDVDFEKVRDHEDWLATYVTDRWHDFIHSGERNKWREEVNEVKAFRYAADTRSTSNSQNPLSHSTHLPKLTQVADTLEAHYSDAMFPHSQWLQFEAGDRLANTEKTRRLIETYIHSRHTLSGYEREMAALLRDWVDEGNCFGEIVWQSDTAGNDNGLLRKAYIGPRLRRIDPRRVAFNTQASTFRESWKIIQSVKTRGDIAQDIMNETLGEQYREILKASEEFKRYIQANMGSLGETWVEDEYDGFGSNLNYFGFGDAVELLTFYGSIYDTGTGEMHLNRKIVIIDRKWVLMNEPIETWDGKPHIYHSTWRERPNTLLGMGPLQNLTGMQYMINHLQNTKADAFDKMVAPDRLFSNIEDMKRQADGSMHFYAHDGGMVSNIAPDTTILNADFQIDALERKMEEYAGVPPEAFGFKTPGEQTKFEVSERINGSARLFQNRIKKFEREVIEPTVNAELELAKVHLDRNLQILTSRQEGDIFEEITPDLIKNKGTLIARGAQHYAQQARMVQELSNFMGVTASDPEIRMHFPPKKIAQAFNSLLGGFGQKDGIYEEFGRLAEQVETQQYQQAAAGMVDRSSIAQQQLDDPEAVGQPQP